jgi:hypothetical protein
MREFIKSVNSYSWAVSLFGLKQMENMLSPRYRGEDRGPATKAMDEVNTAVRRQFGPTLESIFRTGDALQRWTTDATLFMMFPVLMMMSSNRGNESASQETKPRADQNMGDESGATPIRNTREAVSGRKR